MTKFPALFANNITPAAHPPWLATFPRLQASSVKLQASSYKRLK
jgi:hypothetical protein